MLIWSRACAGASLSLILFLSLCPQTVSVGQGGFSVGDRLWSLPAVVEGEGGLVIEEDLYIFQTGPAMYLLGRVHNETDYAQELVLVSWEVIAEDGERARSAEVYLKLLNPGESKPFKLMLPLEVGQVPTQVRVCPGFKTRERPIHLEASAQPYADRGQAYFSLLGEITNIGPEGYDFIKIIVEFLDQEGQLVDIDWAFMNYLEPGTSASFTVYTSHQGVCRWRILFD